MQKQEKKDSAHTEKGYALSTKTVIIGTVILVIVAFSVFAYKGIAENMKTDACDTDIAMYLNVSAKLGDAGIEMNKRLFADTSEALAAFVEEYNKKTSGSYTIAYQPGSSYASGKSDPWGTTYYITAKKDFSNELSTYSFYITSAGENQEFDVKNMVLDLDDKTTCILRGAGTTVLNSGQPDDELIVDSTDKDFGISDIISSKPAQPEQGKETESEDETLPARITISFNMQGGTGTTESIRIKNGVNLKNYSVTVPTRENYCFTGYYSEGNGKGTRYFDANGIGIGTSSFETNLTVFASWIGEEKKIQFDNQGGTSTVSTVTARYGNTLPSVSIPQKSGYTFMGYFDAADGKGIQHYDAQGNALLKYQESKDITLYAYWAAKAFTVEHYVMGTDGEYPVSPTSSKKYSNPNNMTFHVSDLVDNSYVVANGIVFDHAELNGNDTKLVTITESNSVLSIYYRRCEYSVTLNGELGVKSVSGNGTYYYGELVTINAELEDGYVWAGWGAVNTNSNISSSNMKYSFNMPNNHVSLEAYTTLDSYVITLNANGGYCRLSSVSVLYGEKFYDQLPVASREGYTFIGWGTTSDAKSLVNQTTKYTSTSNSILYALWEKGTYIVRFDMQGGQGGTPNAEFVYNSAMPAITIPKKDNAIFMGYFEKPNGLGLQYYNENGTCIEVAKFTESITLYAYWEARDYAINYMDEGAQPFTGSLPYEAPKTYIYGTNLTVPSASKEGYVFSGWYKTSDCSGKPVTKIDESLLANGKITLFAKWKPIDTHLAKIAV